MSLLSIDDNESDLLNMESFGESFYRCESEVVPTVSIRKATVIQNLENKYLDHTDNFVEELVSEENTSSQLNKADQESMGSMIYQTMVRSRVNSKKSDKNWNKLMIDLSRLEEAGRRNSALKLSSLNSNNSD